MAGWMLGWTDSLSTSRAQRKAQGLPLLPLLRDQLRPTWHPRPPPGGPPGDPPAPAPPRDAGAPLRPGAHPPQPEKGACYSTRRGPVPPAAHALRKSASQKPGSSCRSASSSPRSRHIALELETLAPAPPPPFPSQDPLRSPPRLHLEAPPPREPGAKLEAQDGGGEYVQPGGVRASEVPGLWGEVRG